jgi:hypothetical protein
MAVSRVKTSSILQGFPKSRSLLAGNAAFIPTSFESIATFTAAGGETAFNFASIPSTYKHLQFRILSRRTTGINALVALQFNGDTGSNYWWHSIEGDGATVAANFGPSALTTRVQTFWMNPGTNLAGQFGGGIIDIHDYASTTKNKTVKSLGGGDANGAGKIGLFSGSWTNTSAITSVNVYFVGDAVVAGSTFALYGIKG